MSLKGKQKMGNIQQKNRELNIREFLQNFKTIQCKINHNNHIQNCEFFHNGQDRRRKPYFKYTILYQPQICQVNCISQNCKKCHNIFQYQFHPLIYLTSKCTNYNNCQKKYCPYIHNKFYNINSYFFRFDITTFKTILCSNQCVHNLKICSFYHNRLDRRRSDFSHYQHGSCQLKQNCPQGDDCRFSHNKIQQLYHPSRYKSKFCEKYPDKIYQCEYGEFCSFAHQDSEITITLIHNKKRDNIFYIGDYKTIWCPYTTKHDRNRCVYAHNVQDFRRDPRLYHYQPQVCPNWNMNQNLTSLEMGGCLKGMQCNKCHGWKQFQHHPQKYGKTKGKKNNSHFDNLTNNFQKTDIIKILENKNLKNQKIIQEKKKIQPVILDQNLICSMVGAPFFQSDSFYSKQEIVVSTIVKPSYKIKNRGTSSQTDTRQCKSNRKQSIDSYASNSKRDSQDLTNKIFPSKLFPYDQDEFFTKQKFIFMEESTPGPEKKERAKSCQKVKIQQSPKIIYSKQLKQHFMNTDLLERLQQRKINEIKLLNFDQKTISQVDYMTKQQKQLFLKKINEFNERSQSSSNSYSSQLYEFFGIKNKYYLLNKMKNKKVREQKLLNLSIIQIQSLSFLEEQDKKILPKIIKEFIDNKQFSDIASLISQQTKFSNSSGIVKEKQ